MLCYTFNYTFESILEVFMSRSRPATNPVSYHKHTKQYYVTRSGKRIYLGSDKKEALKKHHRLGLGYGACQQTSVPSVVLTIKELANRFIAAQHANWRKALIEYIVPISCANREGNTVVLDNFLFN
jgi:hypothetical protein